MLSRGLFLKIPPTTEYVHLIYWFVFVLIPGSGGRWPELAQGVMQFWQVYKAQHLLMCAAASFSVGWHLAKHCRKRKTRTRVEDVDWSQTGGHRESKLEKEHRGLWDMRHRKRIDSYLAAVLHSRVSVKQPSQIQETIVPSFGDTPHPWQLHILPSTLVKCQPYQHEKNRIERYLPRITHRDM